MKTNRIEKNSKLRKITALLIGTSFVFLAIFLSFQPVQAQPTRIDEKDIKRLGGNTFYKKLKAKHRTLQIKKANVIAPNSSSGNRIVDVGKHPIGFGKTFIWDRKDEELLFAVFLNAADDLGVSIIGVQECDQMQITSAAGIASFAKDTGNPRASSIVGLIGVGAKTASGIFGFPEAIPIINAAEKFAQEEFKATGAKTKRRTAYGVDPASGLKARQEGGIIVSFPDAGEPYYSGDSKHKDRWIKPDGTRTDINKPKHVISAFFPIAARSRHNTRIIRGNNAPLYISPWDYKFEDNAGFYKVFVYLKKGKSPCRDIVR